MKDFQFKIPQTIEFGMGSLKKLPEMLADSKSTNVMLVSDRGLEAIGVVKKVQDIIESAGIKCTAYLDVKPNPTVDIVNEAAALYAECGATCLVALGGGSPMDVSKAVGILAVHGGKIADYEGAHKVPGPIAPIIAIPTTAGTGSEVTASAVITDEERNFKMSVFTYHNIPKYAILDPELIMTAPASIAAACGVDALIHAMEAYLSTAATPFSDAMAEKAMELIGANLRRFVANRKDEEAACAMMLGSNFAGISFAWARLGDIHSMSHPVSAYYHVAHGVANAVLMPTVMEFNAIADHGRYEKIYNYIRTSKGPVTNFEPMMLVEEVKKLNKDLGIPEGLRAVGVDSDEHFQAMAEDAMKAGNTLVNPRQTTVKDFVAMYYKAM
jgi:alcohol dehydrogenase